MKQLNLTLLLTLSAASLIAFQNCSEFGALSVTVAPSLHSQVYFSSNDSTVLYEQTNNNGLDGIFHQMDTHGGAQIFEGLHIYFWDNVYVNRSAYMNQQVSWSVSQRTGFTPAPCASGNCGNTQLGLSSQADTSAVQAHGNEIGIVIDSNSLLNYQNNVGAENGMMSGPIPILIEYVFPQGGGRGPRPFAQAGKVLSGSVDLQIPYSKAEGGSSNQIVLYFGMREISTGRVIAYGAQVWDSRGYMFKNNADAYVAYDVCEPPLTCTNAPMLIAPIGSGGKYNRTVEGTHGFQSSTWSGYRRFNFSFSAANFSAAIAELNSKLNNSPNAVRLSANPADYEVSDFCVDSEVEFVSDGRSPAAMGYSARNIRIAIENVGAETTPFQQLYNPTTGKHAWAPGTSGVANPSSYPGFVVTDTLGLLRRNLDASDLVPIHQFFRASGTDFFFLANASAAEIQSLQESGYSHQGIIGYGYAGDVPGRKPVLSLWSGPESRHFFTSDYSPGSYWVQLPAYGWTQEQVRFSIE